MLSIRTDMTSNKILNDQRINSDLYQRNMEKLSSGLRINSARDDSASLSISERLKSQINESNQRIRNDKMQQSFYQTADGVLSSIGDQLQRLRELTVQSHNGTLTENDKDTLQAEANQILNSIENMGQTATFNGIKIFDESRMNSRNLFKPFSVENADYKSVLTQIINENKIEYIPTTTYQPAYRVKLELTQGEKYTVSSNTNGYLYIQENANLIRDSKFSFVAPSDTVTFWLYNWAKPPGETYYFENIMVSKGDGLTQYQPYSLSDPETGLMSVSLQSLDLKDVGISEENSLSIIDVALDKVNENRSTIGSKLNQLDFNIQNESNKVTNQSQSKSRLSDADFGQTSSELLKNSLKVQSSISMLKKNEQNQQNVLQLFQG